MWPANRVSSFFGTLKEVPQEGSQGLANQQASTLGSLIKSTWIREEAKERGISVSGRELAAEVARQQAGTPGLGSARARENAEEQLISAKLEQVSPEYGSKLDTRSGLRAPAVRRAFSPWAKN